MNNHKYLLMIFLVFCTVLPLMIVEYLRHRSWLKHRYKDFVPGTQQLVLWGNLISIFFLICTFLVGIFYK